MVMEKALEVGGAYRGNDATILIKVTLVEMEIESDYNT